MKRLNKQQALILCLVHHDMGRCMQVCDAAKEMEIGVRKAYRLLEQAKKIVPGLFPILSPKQAKIFHLRTMEGMSIEQMALTEGLSESTIKNVLSTLRKKGVLHPDPNHSRPLSFDADTMSDHVKEKW